MDRIRDFEREQLEKKIQEKSKRRDDLIKAKQKAEKDK